jgi:predicted Fe-Mo cluster-binding NifX family protein
MNEIELKPGYSTVEIPGKCLKCLAEQEYGDCLKGLLKGEEGKRELEERFEALVSLLKSPELAKLRDESGKYLADGRIAAHFGHCEQFAMFNVDDAKKEIVGKELIASPGHQPGLLPVWLAEEGVSVIIAGGMGSRAQSLFAENHIEVVIGTLEDNPEKAVLDYIGGKLVTGNNICDH